MPKHAANMLKVHAKGLLKTKTTQGSKAKENEGTLKETKFPHFCLRCHSIQQHSFLSCCRFIDNNSNNVLWLAIEQM